MNQIERIMAIREGGQTQRCHTFPHSSLYNVAVHSYNAASLLLLLMPIPPSLNLIKAVLWHDVAERWTGDIPSPAKWASPELKQLLDNLEQRIFEKLELITIFKELTTEELNWLTSVDLLELYIWAREQEMFGNPAAAYMQDRINNLFMDKKDKIPLEVQQFKADFYWVRSTECHEFLGEQDVESERSSSSGNAL